MAEGIKDEDWDPSTDADAMDFVPTSLQQAISEWEKTTGQKASEAKEITLQFRLPPIKKMDNTLGALKKCEFLSLSTNTIPKIAGLNGMANLKILSLARNHIKSLAGLAPVAETLEELWISYNDIVSTNGIDILQKLKVFYIRFNKVKDWSEVMRLQKLPALTELAFIGNPLADTMEEADWIKEAAKRLPNLIKVDGEFVFTDLEDDDEEEQPKEGEATTENKQGDEKASVISTEDEDEP